MVPVDDSLVLISVESSKGLLHSERSETRGRDSALDLNKSAGYSVK